MELNYFKDILFDRINEWDQDIWDVQVDDRKNLLWVVMGDGSVFRLYCEKEDSAATQDDSAIFELFE